MIVWATGSALRADEIDSARLDVDSDAVLVVPALSDGAPAAGKRVKVTTPEYAGTDVFHALFLPETWKKGGEKSPVINPPFPALRSGPTTASAASLQKQTPGSTGLVIQRPSP